MRVTIPNGPESNESNFIPLYILLKSRMNSSSRVIRLEKSALQNPVATRRTDETSFKETKS